MSKIPTAEEILDSYSTFDEFGNRIWVLSSVINAMKESNKLHVKAALEAAESEAPMYCSENIKNCYPENLIV